MFTAMFVGANHVIFEPKYGVFVPKPNQLSCTVSSQEGTKEIEL